MSPFLTLASGVISIILIREGFKVENKKMVFTPHCLLFIRNKFENNLLESPIYF